MRQAKESIQLADGGDHAAVEGVGDGSPGAACLPGASGSSPAKRKLTYKEQREKEALEKEMEALGKERAELEAKLSAGDSPFEELQRMSQRIGEVIARNDEVEMRLLELYDISF